jgi:hypothetical protein
MPVVLTEFQRGYQMAIEQTEHMSTIDVVHCISSYRFDDLLEELNEVPTISEDLNEIEDIISEELV